MAPPSFFSASLCSHLGPFYLLDRLQSADGTDTALTLTPKQHEAWKRNMDKVIACAGAYARGYLLHTKLTVRERDTQKGEMCF